ncbi:carotenoid oxygenase family protein [Solihabitans fulvus]|uniref:Dioxygenase n=1 Tax=Solihabitans fulvus TaxID=1892852 RepID=A0A5B2WQ19_9PSEU|nr:carotenoid oxygenase family protein [Solihabitans fulvus]KAA2253575.1 carotenoid oxygenase family protein [Solihabitans fulvus]
MSTVESHADAGSGQVPRPEPLPDFPGFTTLDSEVTVDRLPVTGQLPEWLSGTLIRNGPAKFEVGDYRLTHWFNGLAMLHAFSFNNGQVAYANKYLGSTAYDLAVNKGQLYGKQFGMDPCRALFGRHFSEFSPNDTDNVNVNIARVAGQYLALAEQTVQVEFDPHTLAAKGTFAWDTAIPGEASSPHPHFDFGSRSLISYVTTMGEQNAYQVFHVPDGTRDQRLLATVPTDEPSYIHSFANTENYVVLVEFPVVFDTELFADKENSFLDCARWAPERGARFRVVDKRAGRLVRTFESEAFFAFHHINAAEIGNDILVDIAATHTPYESVLGLPPTEDQFDLERYGYALRRYRLPISGGSDTVGFESLADTGIEMPRINYRGYSTRDYRYAYGLGHSPTGMRAMNQLAKVDIKSGTHKAWYEKGSFPGEPVFVPAPGATREDQGVVLSGVLNTRTGRSFMLVLDGESFGELGRAEVPHHIPNDFHGQFFHDLHR